MIAATLAAACALRIFSPTGTPAPAAVHGPGLVLSGAGLSGAPYPKILQWIDERIDRRGIARAGNLLILSASGDTKYYSDRFFRNSRLASVREITIPPCATPRAVDSVAPYVMQSQVVLFAGGDQAHYVRWKGSKLIAAVRRLYRRGGIVGGGSAGLAIQGQFAFDSVAADRVLPDDEDVATPDAVRNPYERAISFTTNLFAWPALRSSITDTHFARRDRFGRLATFMAWTGAAYGVAVDEDAVLLVDARDVAILAQRAKEADGYIPRGAYILSNGRVRRLAAGKPLLYTVDVLHLARNGDSYDFRTHRGTGIHYRVTIDGSRTPPYSRDPYGVRTAGP